MALITCPECGSKISSFASECPNCGCPVEQEEVKHFTCPDCGIQIPEGLENCPNCGCPFKGNEEESFLNIKDEKCVQENVYSLSQGTEKVVEQKEINKDMDLQKDDEQSTQEHQQSTELLSKDVQQSIGQNAVNKKKYIIVSLVTILVIICSICIMWSFDIGFFSKDQIVKNSYHDEEQLEDVYEPETNNEGPNINLNQQKDCIFDIENYFWLSNRRIEDAEIVNLSKEQLRLLRNLIFARHGYIFKSEDLALFFKNYSWYTPTSHDVSALLSKIELDNIGILKQYEDSKSLYKKIAGRYEYSDVCSYFDLKEDGTVEFLPYYGDSGETGVFYGTYTIKDNIVYFNFNIDIPYECPEKLYLHFNKSECWETYYENSEKGCYLAYGI